MKFSLSKYKRACRDYQSNWKARDDALRALCKKYPNHKYRHGSNAKLWIIARSYATGVERRIESAGTQGSAIEQLSDHFWKNRVSVDKIIRSLHSVREPLTDTKLAQIADAHGRLVRIVQRILKRKEHPRSFVSKYLHFHNPAVPIFDSVVVKGMRKLYPRRREDGSIAASKVQDKDYRSFLMRFSLLYREVRRQGATPSVRFCDYYLLCLQEAK